ncbi:hypothetical protein PQX77_003050, partial [Marasmius sp. AFHP31]
LVNPWATLEGELSDSDAKREARLRERIYLFVRPPSPNITLDDWTSFFHHWSFHESGEPPLSPEACQNLGLPIELQFCFRSYSYSWTTDRYQLMHRYQLLRGFDPVTTDFARHLGFDDYGFTPTSDSDQSEVIYD